MTATSNEDAADAGDQKKINRVVQLAKTAGVGVATPILQGFIRNKVIELVNEHDPEDLRDRVEVQYPLVDEGLDDNMKQTLGSVGPQFEDQIKNTVNPEGILYWLNNPEEYIDADQDEYEQIKRCAEVIEDAPQGRRWLREQVICLWDIAGIIPER
jgi:hypothetical protein